MRRVIRQYIAEFGPLNLFADALAIVSVFALLGIAFASPAAMADPSSPALAMDGAGMGRGE